MDTARRSRSRIIVLLLVATVAMTATLAWQAWQSARSHRATAENVLRDYSRMAAWELSRLGRQQLLNAINHTVSEVQRDMRDGGVAPPAGAGSCPSGCGGKNHGVRTVFRSPLPAVNLESSGEPLAAPVRQLVTAAVAKSLQRPIDFTCPALAVVDVSGTPAVVVWRPLHDRQELPVSVIGFVADVTFVSKVFDQILRSSPLLPTALVGTEKPNTLLALRVLTPERQPLFASAPEWSPYEASESLARDMGSLQLSVALRPESAERLVIGGLPRDRLPFIIGLLALTTGLVGVALVQLRRESELSRMRADFVSGVSHELRTPLAQIRMFTETLLLGRVRSAAEGRRSLEIIARETQRLIELVENVLLFSRSDRRVPVQLSRETAVLAPVIRDVVENFAPVAAARQARIVITLDEAVGANVDTNAVRRILLNLLDNAVKYGPAGQQVDVALQLHDGTARLVVDDEGPGIEAGDAERIWQPFRRLARSTDVTGGAGIGLAIVRQLAELHGGRVSVERAPRGGARFCVEIPGAWSGTAAAAAVA